MGHFLYNSLSKSSKYVTWLLGAISITIPLQSLTNVIEIWPMTDMGHFLYNSLSKSLKYDTWLLGAISITIPYRNHWNVTYGSYGPYPLQFLIKIIEICYDCYEPFPLQFLIKIIDIWPMTAMGHFHYNSSSKPLKYDLWQLWVISIIIPYRNLNI